MLIALCSNLELQRRRAWLVLIRTAFCLHPVLQSGGALPGSIRISPLTGQVVQLGWPSFRRSGGGVPDHTTESVCFGLGGFPSAGQPLCQVGGGRWSVDFFPYWTGYYSMVPPPTHPFKNPFPHKTLLDYINAPFWNNWCTWKDSSTNKHSTVWKKQCNREVKLQPLFLLGKVFTIWLL